jgi:CHASE2 domain-containing sensor protein/tRNA A-37 threonylcarbamoyl transferase component Bud32
MKALKICLICLGLLGLHFLVSDQDTFIQDLFFKIRGPGAPGSNVCIAAIDDVSINITGDWPWGRGRLAELVDSISVAEPAVIFLNFFFRKKAVNTADEGEVGAVREENRALARAMRRAGRVFIPYFFEKFEKDTSVTTINMPPGPVRNSRFVSIQNREESTDIKNAKKLHVPETEIAAGAAGLGFYNIAISRGDRTHLALQAVRYGLDYYPSIGILAAARFLGLKHEELVLDLNHAVRLGAHGTVPMSINGTSMINFFGPGKTFPHVPASEILGKNFDKARLAGKIVIVGVTDPSLKRDADPHTVPYDAELTASELWANIIENALNPASPFIGFSSLWLSLFLPLCVFVGLAFLTPAAMQWGLRRQGLVLGGAGIFLLFFAFVLFLFQKWFSVLVPGLYLGGLLAYLVFRRVRYGAPVLAGPGCAGALSATAVFNQTGQLVRIGRYRITGELGSGAMGNVYKAEDPAIHRTVAVKTLRLDFTLGSNKELRERFSREAHAAGSLAHPNIVTIYDYGDTGSLSYIAMEYLEGQSLEDRIAAEAKLPAGDTVSIVQQVAGALSVAHGRGIIHRDVKPGNIMLPKDTGLVKIMDFGVAKIQDATITQTGKSLGTPFYMSPEVVNGEEADKRADIFSLAVIAYECLCGRRPFTGENFSALSFAILNKKPDPASQVNPGLDPAVDQVFDRALAKDRTARYDEVMEFAGNLSKALGGP